MAYNANFSINSLIIPGSFVLTDTSTGSDAAITGRTIDLYKSDGSLLTGNSIPFPLSMGNSITLNVLNVDYDLIIRMTVQSSSPLPPPSSYSHEGQFLFTGNTQQFINEIIGAYAFNYTTVADTYFYDNLSKVQTELDNAIQANVTGQQAASQAALDRAQFLITNKSMFF